MDRSRFKNAGPGKKAAWGGLLLALAMILSYVETLIPLPLFLPGVKLGLPHLVTVTMLALLGPGPAALICLLRVVLVGLTFGNTFSMLYGLAGAALSLLVMTGLDRTGRFSGAAVSAAGGAAHNIGQMAVAAAVLQTPAVLSYLPILLACGTAAGLLIGLAGAAVLERLPRI